MAPADGELACLITAPVVEARSIARAIVEARVAACVNVVPTIDISDTEDAGAPLFVSSVHGA